MPAKTKAPPAQARSYPPLSAWIGQESNREALQAIVLSPVFIAAMHYVADKHRVTAADLIGERAALPEVIVRKAALHAGAISVMEELRALLIQKATEPELEAWGHILPPTQ